MAPHPLFGCALGAALLTGAFLPSQSRPAAPRVYRDRIEPHWSGTRFWYALDQPQGPRQFVLVDAERGTKAAAFDAERVAQALGERIESIELSADDKSILLVGRDKAWQLDLASYALKDDPAPRRPESAQSRRRGERGERRPPLRSPDGKWAAFVRGHDLWLRELAGGAEHQLTRDGSQGDSYQRDARGARAVNLRAESRAADEPAPDVHWAPDSSRLVALRTRPAAEHDVHLIESSPRDQVEPKLVTLPYLKPGDQIAVRKPRLFDVTTRAEIPVEDALFPTPWALTELRWRRDSKRFTFLYNQRGHQLLRIVAVDAGTGKATTLLDEPSATFVDYAHKHFAEYLDQTGELVWMSERDGWNHLWLWDLDQGKPKLQITKGPWVVRSVDRVDRDSRRIWFSAGGIRPEQDPYHLHSCRVDFDGTGLTVLTEGDGNHTVQWAPDRRWFVDTWSRVDSPPVIELRRGEDGRLVCELERADIRELSAAGRRMPERFVAKGRDGTTDIFGILHWPKAFDPGARYPVLESIYAGPQGAFVPKSFRASYGQQELADLGFVVVQIDGMGTSQRSKAFHDVCWKNLGDSGFPDRILWLKAAAAKWPCLDLTRVGIYGGSAGGQSALRAVLAHGDFYQAAVADCGCHDNRMDKIWWNELWMGWPIGPHYAEQSNVTQAHKLTGKLLLIAGELDRNVDPASTMQVVNALIKADKDFEMLIVPGGGHGSGSSPYGRRRTREFFVRHLLGPER
jgi:dipeptidyl-peptidase-4